MDEAKTNLIEIIKSRTQTHWDSVAAPYLLSRLGPDLMALGIDYKELMKPFRMKQFIELSMTDAVKIVTHPEQRQKTGIIPTAQTYSFPKGEDETADVAESNATQHANDTNIAEQYDRRFNSNTISNIKFARFLSSFDGLTFKELDAISIPLGILARIVTK